MTARERVASQARRTASRELAALAREIREARIGAGRSQAAVAASAGTLSSEVSRIELERPVGLQYETVAAVAAAVGLRVSLRVYPGDDVLTDQAQLRLLREFRLRLGDGWTWRYEVRVAPGDQRAWDMRGRHKVSGLTIVVEAETRMRDLQGTLRRIGLKRDAAGHPRTILLMSDTRNNRAALRAGRDEIATEFPIATSRAIRSLRAGIDPGQGCVIVLRPSRPAGEADMADRGRGR